MISNQSEVNTDDELIARIESYHKLNVKNWDGYDGEPIKPETVRQAVDIARLIQFFDLPGIQIDPAPGGDGSICFEVFWDNGRKEIWVDIEPDGTLRLYDVMRARGRK